ncbi:MAG TPA: PKD domain-containing protein, partial [Candidatus Baltobacteraceae bacterium]|nr:PKD domain-containing protein [Candidatus Baltobacteraceae bacterium]
MIVNYLGAAAKRFMHLELEANGFGTLSVSTPGDLRGHPAATNCFAVAAVDVHTAYSNLFNVSNTNEDFSSDGPRKMFFQANGAPITPGNFTNTGGAIRLKPDISAADGASNSVSGFNPFYGTSAAAPHAAAIAALVWSSNPSLTAAQVGAALTNTTIDIQTPGWDRDSGFGIVMPGAALQSLVTTNPPLPVANFSGGPTNGTFPLTVNFTNLSSGATNYFWTFGDGHFSSSINPVHIYTNAGSFTVSLLAYTNVITNLFSRANFIVVTNVSPSISQQPQSMTNLAGNNATFSVTANGTTPLNYQWRFNTTNISGATTNSFTRTNAQLADMGNYSVVITNVAGSITSAVATLTVTSAPPAVNFSASLTNGISLLTVVFTNLSSGATNYSWNFGDGHTNSAASPTNIYNNQGSYTVTLTAFGAGGQTTLVRSNYIVLSNAPPSLSVISNKTIFETTLLTFDAVAGDADANQNLSFVLSNAPAGAVINSTNGIFAWMPAESQGPGTNT